MGLAGYRSFLFVTKGSEVESVWGVLVLSGAAVVIYVALIPFFKRILNLLRQEVEYLPQNGGQPILSAGHPMVGVTLSGEPWYPQAYRGRPVVAAVMDSACGACKTHLEKILLLLQADQQLPIVCLLHVGQPDKLDSFLERYEGRVPFVLLSTEPYSNLYLDGVPTYFLIDHQGKIVQVEGHYLSAVQGYETMFGKQRVG